MIEIWIGGATVLLVGFVTALLRKKIPDEQEIDGYRVSISTSSVSGEPDQRTPGFAADIDVEVPETDISYDPEYVVSRRPRGRAIGYNVLRGSIHFTMHTDSIEGVQGVAEDMVRYARELAAASRELRSELFQQAMNSTGVDRESGVKNLLRQYPSSGEAQRAASTALIDEHAPSRLAAGIYLGPEALDTVAEIARDESLDAALRLAAFHHLERVAPASSMRMLRDELLGSGAEELREAAIAGYGAGAGPESIRRLGELAFDASPRIAVAIARAFGRIGDRGGRAPLEALLEQREADVLIAAVRALGRLGSTPSLPKILQLANRRGLPEHVREVCMAVIAVMNDSGAIDGGRLSIIDGEGAAGNLSFVENAGAVSYPEKK